MHLCHLDSDTSQQFALLHLVFSSSATSCVGFALPRALLSRFHYASNSKALFLSIRSSSQGPHQGDVLLNGRALLFTLTYI